MTNSLDTRRPESSLFLRVVVEVVVAGLEFPRQPSSSQLRDRAASQSEWSIVHSYQLAVSTPIGADE